MSELFNEDAIREIARSVYNEHDYDDEDDESPVDTFRYHLECELARELASIAEEDTDDVDIRYTILAEHILESFFDVEEFFSWMNDGIAESREREAERISGWDA